MEYFALTIKLNMVLLFRLEVYDSWIRLVDAIYIHYTLSVVIIEDKRPIAIHCNWVSLCIHGHLKCEIDFEPYSKQS